MAQTDTYAFQLAIPTLFLPYVSPGSEDVSSARHEILEIQSVDPTASRSWFMEDDTIVEGESLFKMLPASPYLEFDRRASLHVHPYRPSVSAPSDTGGDYTREHPVSLLVPYL